MTRTVADVGCIIMMTLGITGVGYFASALLGIVLDTAYRQAIHTLQNKQR